jgi:adenylate kinase family enzyme
MSGPRINIFGSPGSGKTKLAEQLGQKLNIKNVYHLDKYFWRPGWIKTDLQERLNILKELHQERSWIIEGSFSNVAKFRVENGDINIHLSISRITCLSRVIIRYLSSIGKKKWEIAPGCLDKLSIKYLCSIWSYPSNEGKELLDQLKKENTVILSNEKEVLKFLNSIVATKDGKVRL